MISGIIKHESLESLPAEEIKNRRLLEDKKPEAKKPEEIDGGDVAIDRNRDTREAMDKIQEAANLFNRKIHLEVEEELNIMIVQVIDSETKEVIRQIPMEELVELSRSAKDLKGLLINKEG